MQRAMGGTSRSLLTLSLSSGALLFSSSHKLYPLLRLPSRTTRVLSGFRPLCTTTTVIEPDEAVQSTKHEILLERLRQKHLKASQSPAQTRTSQSRAEKESRDDGSNEASKKKNKMVGSFEELGLSEEVMGAVSELGIEVPTEIQCIGIPAVLQEKSVVLGSHTGSGKTLAYMLPLVQLLRRDEAEIGRLMKPRRPRAVVLCPTRELSEQVYHVAKSISHHARFRSTMVSGGGRLRPQEDSLNNPIDMVVGTPGRILQHIEDGNMVFGEIRYVVLDEADTMFDRGFGPEIRKFLGPLKNRASKTDGLGFQTVLVTATMTKAVQKLVDEEFEGIVHLRTSSLHKKITSARHDFIKLSGSENKLEALLQVLEPSLAKGNRVMVFCNTLNSSRAVDHFLDESQIPTVNYHGEVPAEQRVKNLEKFKSDDDCPTLVCTDLAARGLDLEVDHVIMFDFPSNSIDYLHRTGRTARMGAKGKVTSLVAKKDLMLAARIEEAMRKNESLESLSVDSVHRDIARTKITEQKGNTSKLIKVSSQKSNTKSTSVKAGKGSSPAKYVKATVKVSKPFKVSRPVKSSGAGTSRKAPSSKPVKSSGAGSSSRKAPSSKPAKFSGAGSSRKAPSSGKVQTGGRKSKVVNTTSSKLSVVGFRGRNSSNKKESMRSS
ncbi:DEAD-box ATP-dependent RNA helicase 39 isoform 1 [Tripterygium wilfordii]|uniref:DEAD-box ATP-dependent RNA helicase 39 isoform 1 n=1 Tax=Tripterygium wilfordii TaxID=458696 RepID=A0A7J7BUZ7_TRIWF|nr:DEAD-box ATP-dependent RNA helicase 39-like [Tripterygium wilfordii]KAF5725658.1 DEAD-box ATP-dependent RNA helicase 39 isoform 1 [Tripterygium wilfordii]